MSLFKQTYSPWVSLSLWRATLFSLPLLDELVGGIPVLTLPLMRDELHLTYTQAGLIFTVAELTALFIEPPLNIASDHWPKARMAMMGMVGLALGLTLASLSPTFGWLLCAFVVMGATNGAAVGIGTSILIDQSPGAQLSTMTRLTLLSTVGDILGPLVVMAALALQGNWRLLMASGALLWIGAAWLLGSQRMPQTQTASTEEPTEESALQSIGANLRTAFKTPLLLRWLLLAMIPTLLDEMFLGFAGLFLKDRLGVSASLISVALGAPLVGGLLGLLVLERWGKQHQPGQILGRSALITLAGLLCFVLAQSFWPAFIGLFFTGLGAACWYPVAKGAAFAALPGRSGTVRALQSLFAPFEIAAPLLIGLAAEQWGIQIGVGLLIVAPVAVLLLRPHHHQHSLQYSRQP